MSLCHSWDVRDCAAAAAEHRKVGGPPQGRGSGRSPGRQDPLMRKPAVTTSSRRSFSAGSTRRRVAIFGAAAPLLRQDERAAHPRRGREGQIMSGTTEQFEGGCLCGAVRFLATGQPKGVAWCHCQSCRKHSGAPVSVFVAFDRTAYTVIKGEITKFNSSPGRWRGFCARCGSTLTCEGEPLPTETHFHVGAFDRAAQLQPTRHIFPEERLPWLHVDDAMPPAH